MLELVSLIELGTSTFKNKSLEMDTYDAPEHAFKMKRYVAY